ncbi:DNA-directed RNA polymerase III subunit RPC8 [Nematocida sp. AWRm80]|nr:DNA-directed RNA polymerase III subunit RPC8 [Nematocida sp. AWRm80]
MFVEVTQRERVPISPKKKNIKEAVFKALQNKVPGHHLEGVSVTLFPLYLESISDIEVHEGVLYPLVTYRLIMYRAYPGEILACTVEKQDSSGILLTHPLLPPIYIPTSQLPEPSELCTISGRLSKPIELWAWNYNDNKLYIKAGEICRIRVLKTGHTSMILGTINGPGLGPLSWW